MSKYGSKKIHEACGQPWTSHTISKNANQTVWVCPDVTSTGVRKPVIRPDEE